MVVVLLGDTGLFDVEYDRVRRAVEDRGVETVVVDTGQWPGDPPVEYAVEEDRVVLGEPVPLEGVTGVFSMGYAFEIPDPDYYDLGDKSPRAAWVQLREWWSLVQSMLSVFEDRGARVTVTPAESYWMRFRPWMLDLYRENDIPVPETTFTNDPDRVRSFLAEHSPAVVTLVNGGGVPRLVREEDLTADLLETLSTAPVKLQAFVPGTDARGFVVDGEVVGIVRYDYGSGAFSHKRPDVDPDDVELSRIDPSPELGAAVRRAGELSPSSFNAVDLRIREDGGFRVLESNNPGRFANPDRTGETDVSAALAEYLVGA